MTHKEAFLSRQIRRINLLNEAIHRGSHTSQLLDSLFASRWLYRLLLLLGLGVVEIDKHDFLFMGLVEFCLSEAVKLLEFRLVAAYSVR